MRWSRAGMSMGACVVAVWVTLAGGASAQAEPRLPGFFTDNMVLQRDIDVPVWGWAEPGENVTVTFAGQEVSATAGVHGKWMAKLQPMAASSQAATLRVTGDRGAKQIALANVVVGEVWICSGQSNMEWTVRQSGNWQAEIQAANHPMIRHMKIQHSAGDVPASDVKSQWLVCEPRHVANFTAVGYYFARQLHQELGVPIGLIGTNWGGTRVEPWTAPEGFRQVPQLKGLADRIDATLPTKPAGKAAYLKTLDELEAWVPAMREAVNSGAPAPVQPQFPVVGKGHQDPTRIYNRMIAPLVPYAIRGAIWYQGESNGNEGLSYFHKKQALIGGWRELWGQGDFPFYFVQLADFREPSNTPAGGDGWANTREAQRKCLEIPNTGMAVITDVGDAKDIHPKNKQDVGKRLALWALAKDYGKDIVYSGPLYKSHAIEGGAIRVSFDHVGGGLMVGRKDGMTPAVEDTGATLKQFAIAGADKKWHWADAKIDGASVVLSSDQVAEPVAVRYAFRMNPKGANLYNREGLPASAFRTDDW